MSGAGSSSVRNAVLNEAFQTAGRKKQERKKRPAPLSLRLSADERARLEAQAAGRPLGAYIKSRVFDDAPPLRKIRKRNPVQDFDALARVLRALGQSGSFDDLHRLAEQVENGTVKFSQETEENIAVACLCVINMRDDLVRALGLRESER